MRSISESGSRTVKPNSTSGLRTLMYVLRCTIIKTRSNNPYVTWLITRDMQTIVEVTPFFLEEFVTYYPEAQFLHMERDIDKWYPSLDNTLGAVLRDMDRFPMKYLRLIDNFVDKFSMVNKVFARVVCHDKLWTEGEADCRKDYLEL
jgi:hypothetical protein